MTESTAETPEQRLAAMGIELPPATSPAANYLPWRRSGDLLYVAGQIPFVDGRLPLVGKVGAQVDLDQARTLARVAALNALAQGSRATGSLSALTLVQVMVFVASTPEFTQQHLVADGASDLFVAVLGEAGRHPRTAVATPVLPLDAPVEVQATFRVDDDA
jgi:enamine deaminase RidA (YjgF/YER057c/UK114 family)